MSSNVPWSINAVEPETWATAREAARRSGLSVGEWLEAAIRGSAGERTRSQRAGNDRLQDQLNDISDRLDQMMDRSRPRAGKNDPLANSIDALTDRIDALIGDIRAEDRSEPYQIKTAIDRLDSRIETLFAQNRNAPSREPDIERKLSEIARQIEMMGRRIELENARYVAAPRTAPSIAELDAAIAEITVRQSALDDGAHSRDLDRKLAAIDARFGFTPRSDTQLLNLEQQIKSLADEMQALRRVSVQADAVESLRREVSDLARTFHDLTPRRSIDALERTVGQLARRIDRSALADRNENAGEIVSALQEIRGALAEVKPAESFAAVERDLQALFEKLDGLNERGIDSATIGRLQSQTGEIRDLLSNALPGEALKTLVGQIETLMQRLEHAPSPNESALLDVVSSLERRIDAFAERVETATRQPGSVPALDEIKKRLEQIEGALDRGDRGAPGGLEATMNSLVDKLDRAEARLSNIGSLERGLNDLFGQMKEVRANAMDVAERVARSPSHEAANPGRPFETESKPLNATRDPLTISSPSISPLRNAPRSIALDPETATVTSSAEGDLPLEPGSGSPRGRHVQSAVERVAMSEAALGGIQRISEPSASTTDYIAAARRAAQAAAAQQPAAEAKKAKPKGSKGSLFGGQKRALMLTFMLVLIAYGSVRFGGLDAMLPFLRGGSPAPVVIKAPGGPDARTPAQNPAASAPEEKPAEPVVPVAPEEPEEKAPDQRSAMPSTENLAATGATPALIAPNLTPNLLTKNIAPEITGSIKDAKAALPPAQNKALAPIPAASTQRAELPAGIGSTALRMAALSGDPAAAFEIGSRWFDGRGVAPSTAEAKRWFELAFSAGSIPAAYRLGNIYEKGNGTPKNLSEARRYYTIAAEGGNTKAMHNLAVLYSEGIDGKPDYKTAATWFRKAADRNVRDSQYNLGVLYARGAGVERNFPESYRWFALAAAQGDDDSLKKRDDIAKRLDPQALVIAQKAVKEWTPMRADESANTVALDPQWNASDIAKPRKKTAKQ